MLKAFDIQAEVVMPSDLPIGAIGVGRLDNRPTLIVNRGQMSLASRIKKRVVDILISAIALIVLAPLLVAVAIAIRLDSPGPVLFRQLRVGYGNRPFEIFKFRSLRHEATERPFSSPLNNEHRAGVFACKGCALPLFDARTKFDSGTGWPSFYAPLKNALGTNGQGQFVNLGFVKDPAGLGRIAMDELDRDIIQPRTAAGQAIAALDLAKQGRKPPAQSTFLGHDQTPCAARSARRLRSRCTTSRASFK